mgnify:FL=1
MAYECKVLADSLSPCGVRLTTMQVTFPRIVLAEFNTHRVFSRNTASSRANPVEKQIRKIEEDPFIPVYWGKNQKGMSADVELTPEEIEVEIQEWLADRNYMVDSARRRMKRGVHKQIANRPLEAYMWHTCIVSATEWANFFALRCHKDAQPEIRVIAEMMRAEYNRKYEITLPDGTVDEVDHVESLTYGEWHLPLVTPEERIATEALDLDPLYWVKVSAGRCARVSYLTHDGRRAPEEDVALCDRLMSSGHMSPLEHPATPYPIGWEYMDYPEFCGNFRGWTQYRKTILGEAVFNGKV